MGYYEEVIASGQVVDDHLHLSAEAYDSLLQKYRPIINWPMSPFGVMARTLKLFRTPDDKGVGDTLARIVGPIGGDAYKVWFKETFGRTCGCTERQEKINEQFPY